MKAKRSDYVGSLPEATPWFQWLRATGRSERTVLGYAEALVMFQRFLVGKGELVPLSTVSPEISSFGAQFDWSELLAPYIRLCLADLKRVHAKLHPHRHG